MIRRIFCFGSIVLLALNSFADESIVSTMKPQQVPGTPFQEYKVKDSSGREITYYLSKSKKVSAPILLMIQGSGCVPLLNIQPTGAYSTLFNLIPFAQEGDFSVLAVEKPYSGVIPNSNPASVQESCNHDFHHDFTAESWLLALTTSLKSARRNKWIDNNRTLVIGMSEGATMAALLASHDSKITDVISIGGSGTTQLFDFIAFAYDKCFDVSNCLDGIHKQVALIRQNPTSSDKFAWGHPFKRWSSFFPIDPSEELIKSKARIYIAFGTSDESTPPLSVEVAISKLTAAGKDVTVRRVPDGGHNLLNPGSLEFSDLDKEYRKGLAWFFSGEPK